MKLELKVKKVSSLKEMRLTTGGALALYQPYFHRLSDGNFQLRVVTDVTNPAWITAQAQQGNIYVPEDKLTAERS